MTYLKYPASDYFNNIIPLEGKDVLDWGCNHGNFLINMPKVSSYTGVDIDPDVIKTMSKTHNKHDWLYYKHHNPQYSDYHSESQWPPLETYDVICAFSVFTHTSFKEMMTTTCKLKSHLNDNGSLLQTYMHNTISTLESIFSHRSKLFQEHDTDLITKCVTQSEVSTVAIHIDSNQLYLFPNVQDFPQFYHSLYYLTFYNEEWLADKTGGEIVDITNKYDSGIMSIQRCLRQEK